MALVMSRMQIWLYVMLLTRPPRLSSDFTRMPLKSAAVAIAPNRSRIGVDGEVVDTDVLNSAGHHAIVGRVVPVSFAADRHAVAGAEMVVRDDQFGRQVAAFDRDLVVSGAYCAACNDPALGHISLAWVYAIVLRAKLGSGRRPDCWSIAKA